MSEPSRLERFRVYRLGWRLGASAQTPETLRRYAEHVQRLGLGNALSQALQRGFKAGKNAMILELADECERLGYDATISELTSEEP